MYFCCISPVIDSSFDIGIEKSFTNLVVRTCRSKLGGLCYRLRESESAPVWYRCFRWEARFLGAVSVAHTIPTNPDRVFLFLFSFSYLFLTLTCARSIKLSARSITIDIVERNRFIAQFGNLVTVLRITEYTFDVLSRVRARKGNVISEVLYAKTIRFYFFCLYFLCVKEKVFQAFSVERILKESIRCGFY